jgi:hypothetical protein
MSDPSPKSIFSAELPSGPPPPDSSESPTTDLFGAPVAPVRHSAPQAKSKPAQAARGSSLFQMFDELASSYAEYAATHGLPISATSGPKFGGSFETPARHALWESRLRQQTDALGSTLYALQWKSWPMTLGESIPALRASARPISDPACIGWPTPRTPTGGAESAERKKELGRTDSGGGDLQAAALVCGWATPSSRDWKDTPGMATHATNPDGSERVRLDQLPRQANLAGWPTATATDAEKRGTITARPGMMGLSETVPLAGWPTPRAEDSESSGTRWSRGKADTLTAVARITGPTRRTASGEILTGSAARMTGGGQLSPAHSLWLMLGPLAMRWLICAERVKRPSRKGSRPASTSTEPENLEALETPSV